MTHALRLTARPSARRWPAIGCILLLSAAGLIPAYAQGAGQPQDAQRQTPIQMDRNGVLILIRSTLLALDHANRTGNYTVLRDLGAPGFQSANTAARLAEIFAHLRAQDLDLSSVAVLEPQFAIPPTTVQGGMMHMAGFFPTVPVQIDFEFLFAPVDGRWRLFGISLAPRQAGPVVPAQPPEQPPPARPNSPAGAQPEARATTPQPSRARRPTPQRPAQAPAGETVQ